MQTIRAILAIVAGESIATAVAAPHSAPRMAKPRLLDVYENVTAAMVRVWREPAAKAWFVAVPNRREVGTAMPAMNDHLADQQL